MHTVYLSIDVYVCVCIYIYIYICGVYDVYMCVYIYIYIELLRTESWTFCWPLKSATEKDSWGQMTCDEKLSAANMKRQLGENHDQKNFNFRIFLDE